MIGVVLRESCLCSAGEDITFSDLRTNEIILVGRNGNSCQYSNQKGK